MLEWILESQGVGLYLVIFLLLMGGAVGLPIPEDIPLLMAGVLVHEDRANAGLMLVTCYVAVVLGDVIIFHAGRRVGPALFKKEWFKRRMPPERLAKLRERLEKRSLLMIFVARHLFYLRTVTFLICGAVHMRRSRFLIADLLAALVSAPLMMTLGYFGAHQFQAIIGILSKVKILLVVSGALGLIGYLVYKWRQRVSESVEK